MNLYLFPAPANNFGGYNIGVLTALEKKRIVLQDSDIVFWCSPANSINPFSKETHFFIDPLKLFSIKSAFRILSGKFSQEISVSDLNGISSFDFDQIHCDEVIFYRAIKKLFPNKRITVRLHNLFARIYERSKILNIKSDWRYWGKMKILYNLEKMIITDSLVHKVFVCEEDANYYELITGKKDYSIWLNGPDDSLMIKNRKPLALTNKIAWLGGVEGHKISSIKWFINNIYSKIKENEPNIEFHLYGANTEQFDNPTMKIFGHGYYSGEGIPLSDEALFVNPDILGGGIKIKLLTFLNNGIPFISSPFGYEGYSKDLIDNKYCNVVEDQYWVEIIVSIFRENKV